MPPKSKAAPAQGKSAITSFFKPTPSAQSQTPVADSPASSSQPRPQSRESSSSLPSLPSSRPPSEPTASSPAAAPSQPPKSASRVSQLASSPALRSPSPLPPSSPIVKPPAPRQRDAVIAASDDEDEDFGGSDSDDDMVDIMSIWDPRRDANKPAVDASLFETPKAKRIMSKHVHSSPLTIQFKHNKHDFDMKALLKDTEQDQATKASYLQNQEEAAAQAEAQTAEAKANKDEAVLNVIAQAGGENAHKVFRTMKRGQTSQGALRYCFFERDPKPKGSLSMPSKKVATGPWRLLIQGSVSKREQYLVSGMPYTILRKTGGLPPELFDWMLSDLCLTQSRLMQMEYSKLISLCPDLVHSRLTPDRLNELFSLLGEADELEMHDGKLALTRPSEDPYMNKEWSNLRAFLELLAEVAETIPVDSIAYAAHTLLRMAMDKFVLSSMDVLMDYEKVLSALLNALPALAWNSFCGEASQRLHQNFKSPNIRINALLCIPISSNRVHELRRRLAVAFLFDDPSLGARHPDSSVTIRRIIERVRSKDFDITPETDFAELSSTVIMLDMAVDDGSWVATTRAEDEKQFNADVDELAAALRGVSRRINDARGKTTASNVKGVFEWVEKRMAYQVRAKPQPKMSIFDTVKDKEDRHLPQQQNYMSRFLGKPVGNTRLQGADEV